LLAGKGGIMLAGYNTNPKNVKAKKYLAYFLRRFGFFWCMMSIFCGTGAMLLFYMEDKMVGGILVGIGIAFAIIMFAISYTTNMQRAMFLAMEYEENPDYEDVCSKYDTYYEYFKKKEMKNEVDETTVCDDLDKTQKNDDLEDTLDS